MKLSELRASLDDEASTILRGPFQVEVTDASVVPHSDDVRITFPNLDERRQACKLIDTCVLYIDIRRSTELNLSHRATIVARLYSAFVRAMSRAARHYRGHVRGIIGDRVMVLFDSQNAFTDALDCAILMNTVASRILNKYFKQNEVACGIGIDAGKMLVTKTGIIKRGEDGPSYRNLVWLGRPANVASKLTDLANKAAETIAVTMVRASFDKQRPLHPDDFTVREYWPHEFVTELYTGNAPHNHAWHSSGVLRKVETIQRTVVVKEKTPPILMTRAVWDGFRKANPTRDTVTKANWVYPVQVDVSGFDDLVYGCNLIKTGFDRA